MLTKPDDDITTALGRMARSAEWKILEAWLLSSREACIQGSFSEDETICRKNQGGALVIDELIKHTRAAVESSTRR